MKSSKPSRTESGRQASWIKTTLRLLRAFFTEPIALGRRTAAADQAAIAARRVDDQKKHVAAMLRDLGALFERHADSRRMMQNLSRVEQALRNGGLRQFEALPSTLVSRALQELERLVWDWSPAGLAELRSRMAVLLKRPPIQVGAAETAHGPAARTDAKTSRRLPPADPPDFDIARGTDISEVGHDVFEEMERSWRGTPPKDGKTG